MLRPAYVKTPCVTCPKIPEHVKKDNDPRDLTRAHAIEWTERSREVYEHYMGCKAVGVWPMVDGDVEPLVKRHARLLREYEDRRDRLETGLHFGELTSLLAIATRKK